mmetsp:Transcript_9092/g.6847  ORF Transcript_9092/g.6847 Transcript_9092/m.6847 type:complete len:211 (-) Transcript_9092:829-1461(-)
MEQLVSDTMFVRLIILLTTGLAVVSLLIRMWLYTFWIDYKSSKQFYFRLMELQQVNKPEKQFQQKFKTESNLQKFVKLIFSWGFFFEFLALAIFPYPGVERLYTFEIIDMLGSKSSYLAVDYYLSDFLFAFMFLRIYFLVRTLFNFTIYTDLYSKKVCVKHGFEASTYFYVKALFVKRTGLVIFMVSAISIMLLSYVLRIFERVYYNTAG